MGLITVTKEFKASSAQLFQAWIDPKILEKWCVTFAKVEAKEGGKFRFETKIGKDEIQVVEGEYSQIITNELIVKTWTYQGFDGEADVESVVTVEFEELDAKKTKLTITEEGEMLSDPEYAEMGKDAWDGALEMLATVCK